MPGTAKDLGVRHPFDAKENMDGAARYLAGLFREFKGDIRLALAAYNAGSGAVRKYRGVPPFAETRNFVESIMARL